MFPTHKIGSTISTVLSLFIAINYLFLLYSATESNVRLAEALTILLFATSRGQAPRLDDWKIIERPPALNGISGNGSNLLRPCL